MLQFGSPDGIHGPGHAIIAFHYVSVEKLDLALATIQGVRRTP
jgi:hypothetical protein